MVFVRAAIMGLLVFFVLVHFSWVLADFSNLIDEDVIKLSSYVYWPNATIPFYIHPEHYDNEQSLAIMTALSLFAFKTCLKFAPVLARPEAEHVMVFQNPEGARQCVLDRAGHSIDTPHIITLGYDCLKSPDIDMVIMRALGFPFEHNRAARDLYIDVQKENIQPGAIELFAKDLKLPLELRALPYDANSVLHFDERAHSKNGHRTIIFKDHKVVQKRESLTATDLRKIETVYGPECRKRERQEKIELCQSYPVDANTFNLLSGAIRNKRELVPSPKKSLRVNPDITPPPDVVDAANVTAVLVQLGIENEVQEVVEQIYRISSLALKKAQARHCNNTDTLRTSAYISEGLNNATDILGIVEVIADYAKTMVDHALVNLTAFCENSADIHYYQRACPYYDQAGRCVKRYLTSTKSGAVKYSTQHRPPIRQSTKNVAGRVYKAYAPMSYRSGNYSDEDNTTKVVKKRQVEFLDVLGYTKTEDTTASVVTAAETAAVKPKTATNSTATNVTKEGRRNSDDTTNAETTETVKQNEKSTDTKSKEIQGRIEMREGDGSVAEGKGQLTKLDKPRNDPSRRVLKPLRSRPQMKSKRMRSKESMEIKMKEPGEVKKRLERERIMKIKKEEKKAKEERMNEEQKEVAEYEPETVELTKKNREFYGDRKWRDNVVRYIIQDDPKYDIADMRRRLEEVNQELKAKTCVRLQEIREGEANKYEDYLVLDTSPDYVTGRVGGRQVFGVVELFRGGQHRQHAAMMVMAMLGFYFECARHDRDKHIRVHMRHVRPDKLHHFEKIREDATFPLSYDYDSATHPAWQFWRQIGRTGISTVATYKEIDPDGALMRSLGQHTPLLSDYDLIKINSVYGIKCFTNARRLRRKRMRQRIVGGRMKH